MILTSVNALFDDAEQASASLVITVHGTPKPKGSLKHVGHGRLVEQVAGSKPWRIAVIDATRAALLVGHIGAVPIYRPPLEGPLLVDITHTVAKPKSAPKRKVTWPVTRSSGDVDKLARNALDALTDAKAFGDDSQVLEVRSRKTYPGQHRDALNAPGAVIRVWALGSAS